MNQRRRGFFPGSEDTARPPVPVRVGDEHMTEAPAHDAEEVPQLHEVDCPAQLRAQIEDAMSHYPDRHSAAIPALWAVQRRYGWCTPEGIRQAAAVMRVTPAYLESVASFYDLFHTEPSGRHRILVCSNISCWMNGADALLAAFCDAAGADLEQASHEGATTEDGAFYVSGFECLGACELAPMAAIDERYYGPLDAADAPAAIGRLRDGGDPLPGKSLAGRPAAGGPDPDPRLGGGEEEGRGP